PACESPSASRRACHWPPRMERPESKCRRRIKTNQKAKGKRQRSKMRRGQSAEHTSRIETFALCPLPFAFSSLPAHVPRFGIFQKCVNSRHMCDGQSFHAVEEPSLKKVAADKCPGGIEDQFAQSDPGFPEHQLFGSERRVSVEGAQVLGKRVAGKVQQVRFKMSHAAIHLHAFVHEFSNPSTLLPVVEPHLAVGI